MSPRDFIFQILLLSIVRFSMTSVIWPQSLFILRLWPEAARSSVEDVPDGKAPQIEIQLMKSHASPDEKWMSTNEYKYLGKDYYGPAKMTSTTNEKKVPRIENGDTEARKQKKLNDVHDEIMMPDRFFQPIGSRNIVTAPERCPKGQRQDSNGRCRLEIP